MFDVINTFSPTISMLSGPKSFFKEQIGWTNG